jgi:hypothetical protein
MTIHLHNNNQIKGVLKEDLNKKPPLVIPSKPVNRLKELTEKETMQKIDSIIKKITGFGCVAEYNYYRNLGR